MSCGVPLSRNRRTIGGGPSIVRSFYCSMCRFVPITVARLKKTLCPVFQMNVPDFSLKTRADGAIPFPFAGIRFVRRQSLAARPHSGGFQTVAAP